MTAADELAKCSVSSATAPVFSALGMCYLLSLSTGLVLSACETGNAPAQGARGGADFAAAYRPTCAGRSGAPETLDECAHSPTSGLRWICGSAYVTGRCGPNSLSCRPEGRPRLGGSARGRPRTRPDKAPSTPRRE